MAEELFVVPPDSYTDVNGDPNTEPKYVHTHSGVDGYSGTIHFFDADTWPDVPWSGSEMFVVRVYGTQTAIDDIASHDDAYGQTEYSISDQEIADYLNDRFGYDYTFSEWMDRFQVN